MYSVLIYISMIALAFGVKYTLVDLEAKLRREKKGIFSGGVLFPLDHRPPVRS